MATNQKVKKALLAKLDVTPQRLSQMVKKRKGELPMTTEHAVYTFAHEHGVDIGKELDAAETAEVRSLVSQLRAMSSVPTSATNGSRTTRATAKAPKSVVVTIAGVNVEKLPGMTAAHAKGAKMMAEKVYPTVYVFENSVRDLIERVLKAQFGSDWWTQAVPAKVQTTAQKHKDDEKKGPLAFAAREIATLITSFSTTCGRSSTTSGSTSKISSRASLGLNRSSRAT